MSPSPNATVHHHQQQQQQQQQQLQSQHVASSPLCGSITRTAYTLDLGCDEHITVVEEGSPEVRPAYTYAEMITLALSDAPSKALALSQIYKYIEARFPFYRSNEPTSRLSWQNSIRHNLSLRQQFIKLPDAPKRTTRGSLWTFSPEAVIETRPIKQRKRAHTGPAAASSSSELNWTPASSPSSVKMEINNDMKPIVHSTAKRRKSQGRGRSPSSSYSNKLTNEHSAFLHAQAQGADTETLFYLQDIPAGSYAPPPSYYYAARDYYGDAYYNVQQQQQTPSMCYYGNAFASSAPFYPRELLHLVPQSHHSSGLPPKAATSELRAPQPAPSPKCTTTVRTRSMTNDRVPEVAQEEMVTLDTSVASLLGAFPGPGAVQTEALELADDLAIDGLEPFHIKTPVVIQKCEPVVVVPEASASTIITSALVQKSALVPAAPVTTKRAIKKTSIEEHETKRVFLLQPKASPKTAGHGLLEMIAASTEPEFYA